MRALKHRKPARGFGIPGALDPAAAAAATALSGGARVSQKNGRARAHSLKVSTQSGDKGAGKGGEGEMVSSWSCRRRHCASYVMTAQLKRHATRAQWTSARLGPFPQDCAHAGRARPGEEPSRAEPERAALVGGCVLVRASVPARVHCAREGGALVCGVTQRVWSFCRSPSRTRKWFVPGRRRGRRTSKRANEQTSERAGGRLG